MLVHSKWLPTWGIWECVWNERGKAAVNAVKRRGCIKARALIYERVSLWQSF